MSVVERPWLYRSSERKLFVQSFHALEDYRPLRYKPWPTEQCNVTDLASPDTAPNLTFKIQDVKDSWWVCSWIKTVTHRAQLHRDSSQLIIGHEHFEERRTDMRTKHLFWLGAGLQGIRLQGFLKCTSLSWVIVQTDLEPLATVDNAEKKMLLTLWCSFKVFGMLDVHPRLVDLVQAIRNFRDDSLKILWMWKTIESWKSVELKLSCIQIFSTFGGSSGWNLSDRHAVRATNFRKRLYSKLVLPLIYSQVPRTSGQYLNSLHWCSSPYPSRFSAVSAAGHVSNL